MNETGGSTKEFRSVFLDPAWLVASLLAFWGVVIAMEEFLLADGFAIAAGLVICLKIGAETHLLRKDRKPLIFTIAFVATAGLVTADIVWTEHKKREALERDSQLAQLSDLPTLRDRLQKMEEAQVQRSEEARIREVKSGQKLNDIEQQNKGLRRSVETKDAALISIAKQQYALNFFPQVIVSTNGSPDTMSVTNNGKTNIEIYRLSINGSDAAGPTLPETVAPSSVGTFVTTDAGKAAVISQAQSNGGTALINGTVYILTLDKKKYQMTFSWTYKVTDGNIEKSFITDGPIVESQ
jgi:hypothetical protein